MARVFDRLGGPMSFRFILQPIMATIAALHDGIGDARTGRPPYLRTILNDPDARGARLQEGLFSTSRIILLGFAMDAIYQWRVLGHLLSGRSRGDHADPRGHSVPDPRGPIGRIARWWFARHPKSQSEG